MPLGTRPGAPEFNGAVLNQNAEGSSRFPLTESPFGIPISVGTSATLIHSCSMSSFEEVYLWAHDYNASSTEITMSITFAGSSDSFDTAATTMIAPLNSQNGLYLVYPGVPHRGCEVYAKAAAGASVNVVGFIMRHYPEDVNNIQAGYNGSNS